MKNTLGLPLAAGGGETSSAVGVGGSAPSEPPSCRLRSLTLGVSAFSPSGFSSESVFGVQEVVTERAPPSEAWKVFRGALGVAAFTVGVEDAGGGGVGYE